MIHYITSENSVARLPVLFDLTLAKEITLYARDLTVAKIIDPKTGDSTDLEITMQAPSIYVVHFSKYLQSNYILELTDTDETVNVTIHIELTNDTAINSWLQRQQLLYLRNIFDRLGYEWTKRFTLFAQSINKFIGTYQGIDLVMDLLDIKEYRMSREWINRDTEELSWLGMTDASLVNNPVMVPTGNLLLHYTANNTLFTTAEVLSLVRHVLPAVNYIEDIDSKFVHYKDIELYVVSMVTELSMFDNDNNYKVQVSSKFSIHLNQLRIDVYCSDDSTIELLDRVFYLTKGLTKLSIRVPEDYDEIDWTVHTVNPNNLSCLTYSGVSTKLNVQNERIIS